MSAWSEDFELEARAHTFLTNGTCSFRDLPERTVSEWEIACEDSLDRSRQRRAARITARQRFAAFLFSLALTFVALALVVVLFGSNLR